MCYSRPRWARNTLMKLIYDVSLCAAQSSPTSCITTSAGTLQLNYEYIVSQLQCWSLLEPGFCDNNFPSKFVVFFWVIFCRIDHFLMISIWVVALLKLAIWMMYMGSIASLVWCAMKYDIFFFSLFGAHLQHVSRPTTSQRLKAESRKKTGTFEPAMIGWLENNFQNLVGFLSWADL